MKYPQLVSTRAVNAISDWLVARLEQLGVEAPHIYTRLLLSLLQSTVQLNDPIEFSNLESFLASRKGGNKRYRECDIDELKKFNAVQCIKDIVSSDQEIATIENLVEELYERLKDIEKQSSDSEEDDRLPLATLSITQRENRTQQRREVPAHSKSCRASCRGVIGDRSAKTAEAAGTSTSARQLNKRELEYCLAFPSLSKQMGESMHIWRRNSTWMPWPAEKPADEDEKQNAATSSGSSTISSNSEAEGGNQGHPTKTGVQRGINARQEGEIMDGGAKIDENAENAANVSGAELCDDIVDESDEVDDDEAVGGADIADQASGSDKGAIKRNSKRRRNRALPRKNATAGADSKNKRNLSPTCWDTDFEGCWEMGPDLIKEFKTSQNCNSRNRSTSESAVSYNNQSTAEKVQAAVGQNVADDNCETAAVGEPQPEQQQQQPNAECEFDENKATAELEALNATKAVTPVEISFCDYDDFDDTLASVSELTNDGPLTMFAGRIEGACALPPTNARRLYERELPKEAKSDVQTDLAQFEAKFNSSVKALWKNANCSEQKAYSPFGDDNKFKVDIGIAKGEKKVSGATSLPTEAPLSQNLKNFWSNYYNQRFDLRQMVPTSVIGKKAKELDKLMQEKAKENAAFKANVAGISGANNFCNAQPAVANINTASTSDYYSMPSNVEEIGRSTSQRTNGCSDSGNGCVSRRSGGTIGEERKTPMALFLQNTIWSENANSGGGDSDETFYYKVHNSGNQLNAYDDDKKRPEKVQCEPATSSTVNISNDGGGFAFATPYSAPKWSEGINAGPPAGNTATPLEQHKQRKNNSFPMSLNATDCTDAAYSRASNWHRTSAEANSAWAAERLYGTNAARSPPRDNIDNAAKPKITLVNHSATSSGFIAYSRIKAVLKLELSSDGDAYPPRANSKERPVLDMMDDGENLLTSERTHFHPIKSYVDGHTFDINSELDVVQYQRSASGYLYVGQDRYLEYTRTDNFVVEDDGGIGASSNPLYANSNCEAATSSANARANARANYVQQHATAKRGERDFVIKFRVQRTEIACQTDPEPPTAAAHSNANKRSGFAMHVATTAQPHPISLIFSNAAKNLKATASNQLAYTNTAEAFTRAIAHFPPPQPQMGTDVGDGPAAAASSSWNVYQEQSKLQRNAKSNGNDADDDDDDTGCDEVDFNGSLADICDSMEQNASAANAHAEVVGLTSLELQWSTNEIRKKCRAAGHMTTYASASGSSSVDGAIESVWGMCAACIKMLKSIPANEQLCAEVKVEADEIMSDLKYMQDLYIGSASGGSGGDDVADVNDEDEDVGGADEESAAETVTTSDSDWCADEVTAEVADECALNLGANNERNDEPAVQQTTADSADGAANRNDSEAFTVIQKVNRLIAELLRPDNAGDGGVRMNNLNPVYTAQDARQLEADATTFSGNLWHTNERNIWQLSAGDNANSANVAGGASSNSRGAGVSGGGADAGAGAQAQPLRQYNVEPVEAAATSVNADNAFPLPATADGDQYRRQISWEHENLARIWQTSQPPPPQPQPQQPIQMATNDVGEPQAATATENATFVDCAEQADIAEKNMRNLRANADASVEAAAANLQLAHQLMERRENNVPAALTNTQLVDSAFKFKAITRKRRHSASQNYFHAHLQGSGAAASAAVAAVSGLVGAGGVTQALHNNNNNEIANLNSYTLTSLHSSRNASNELSWQNLLNASLRFGAAAAAAAVAASNAKKCSDFAASARNRTIITCKYQLTAIEPAGAQQNANGHNNNNNEYGLFTGNGNGIGDGLAAAPLSTIIDKNPSILNHVTMVSRPLTR